MRDLEDDLPGRRAGFEVSGNLRSGYPEAIREMERCYQSIKARHGEGAARAAVRRIRDEHGL